MGSLGLQGRDRTFWALHCPTLASLWAPPGWGWSPQKMQAGSVSPFYSLERGGPWGPGSGRVGVLASRIPALSLGRARSLARPCGRSLDPPVALWCEALWWAASALVVVGGVGEGELQAVGVGQQQAHVGVAPLRGGQVLQEQEQLLRESRVRQRPADHPQIKPGFWGSPKSTWVPQIFPKLNPVSGIPPFLPRYAWITPTPPRSPWITLKSTQIPEVAQLHSGPHK